MTLTPNRINPRENKSTIGVMDIVHTTRILKNLSACQELIKIRMDNKGTRLPLKFIIRILSKAIAIQQQNKIKSSIKPEEEEKITKEIDNLSTGNQAEKYLYKNLIFLTNRGGFHTIDVIIDKTMSLKRNETMQFIKETIEKGSSNNLVDMLQAMKKEILNNLVENISDDEIQGMTQSILSKNLVEFSSLENFVKFFEEHITEGNAKPEEVCIEEVFNEEMANFDYRVIIKIIKGIFEKQSINRDLSQMPKNYKEALK